VVEDEPDIARLMSVIFDSARYTLTWVGDLLTARARIRVKSPPDLVLLDEGLPDGSGLDLCRELKRRWPLLPVLLVTALPRSSIFGEALAAGADDFIAKPFDPDALLAAAEMLVSGAVGPPAGAGGQAHGREDDPDRPDARDGEDPLGLMAW
jgi:two-component system catabolic regulation response regulator CreB